jgi:hypothetical protein
MRNITRYIVAALFTVVASAATGTSEINPTVLENKSTPKNVLQPAPNTVTKSTVKNRGSKNKIKFASTKSKHKLKSSKKTKKSKKSAHTNAHLACWSVGAGTSAYACSDSKNTPATTNAAVVVKQTGPLKKVGPIQPATFHQKTYPKKIHKMQPALYPPPTICDAFKSTDDNSADNLNTKSVTAIENVGEKSVIGHPYLGIMAGMGFAKVDSNQQLDTTVTDDEYDKYLPANNLYSAAVYGLNGGYEFIISSNGLLSLGVGVYQSSDYRAKGQVWHVYEPNGNDHIYDYRYRLQSTRFMFETQFAWQFDFKKIKLIPFISFGVGSALNFANSYEETPVNSSAEVVPGFGSNKNTSFAYQLGAGIACPFSNDRDRLFVAYKYVDLGKAQFNAREMVNGINGTYRLDVKKIIANEIYIGYTHLFNF